MFSTLLSSIQTALTGIVSKSFVLAGLFPTLLFLVINGLLFWATGGPIPKQFSDVTTWAYFLAMLGTLTLAYLLTSLSTTMLETLEGRHLFFLEPLFFIGQSKAVDKLNQQINESSEEMRLLTVAADPPPHAKDPSWRARLNTASVQGQTKHVCDYPFSYKKAPPDHASRLLHDLDEKRLQGKLIRHNEIEKAVRALVPCLAGNDENQRPPTGSNPLNADRILLIRLIGYARDRRKSEQLRLWNFKQFSYPGEVKTSELSTANILAPTAFGNVGRTMRSYALTRYSLDLDLFWSRLQRSIQNGSGGADKFYIGVQDAKTQVDFLVAMTFLLAITTVAWTFTLLYQYRQPLLFLGVAACGPPVVYIFYRLACQAYRVFADLIRTSVDVYRFQLLNDLHVAPPAGTREEEKLWNLLGNRTGYASDADLNYTSKS